MDWDVTVYKRCLVIVEADTEDEAVEKACKVDRENKWDDVEVTDYTVNPVVEE